MLPQTDVTARVEAERRLVELTAAQTGMLESMFPRHGAFVEGVVRVACWPVRAGKVERGHALNNVLRVSNLLTHNCDQFVPHLPSLTTCVPATRRHVAYGTRHVPAPQSSSSWWTRGR